MVHSRECWQQGRLWRQYFEFVGCLSGFFFLFCSLAAGPCSGFLSDTAALADQHRAALGPHCWSGHGELPATQQVRIGCCSFQRVCNGSCDGLGDGMGWFSEVFEQEKQVANVLRRQHQPTLPAGWDEPVAKDSAGRLLLGWLWEASNLETSHSVL